MVQIFEKKENTGNDKQIFLGKIVSYFPPYFLLEKTGNSTSSGKINELHLVIR